MACGVVNRQEVARRRCWRIAEGRRRSGHPPKATPRAPGLSGLGGVGHLARSPATRFDALLPQTRKTSVRM